MSKIKVSINGFGRIGRCLFRALHETRHHERFQVVAINELAEAETVRHLLKYDSTHGSFRGEITGKGSNLIVDGEPVKLLKTPAIEQLPWQALGVDLVFECTGSFSDKLTAIKHLSSGAKKVLFSQPADRDVEATIVYGVNHSQLEQSMQIVSAASCTTNAVVPVLNVIEQKLGIESVVTRTIHSAMNDQPVIDAYHHTDLRKTRAAFNSLIPVETGLAAGIARILPVLSGRIESVAMRVPVANVSAIDLTLNLNTDTTAQQLNELLRQTVENDLFAIIDYTEEPLASCDFNHNSHSCIVDGNQTIMVGKRLAKLLIWFDNEWGYANRMLDVAAHWQQ